MSTTPPSSLPRGGKPNKAITGFAVAALVLLLQSLDPSAANHVVTGIEWLVTVFGGAGVGGAVYAVSNHPKRDQG